MSQHSFRHKYNKNKVRAGRGKKAGGAPTDFECPITLDTIDESKLYSTIGEKYNVEALYNAVVTHKMDNGDVLRFPCSRKSITKEEFELLLNKYKNANGMQGRELQKESLIMEAFKNAENAWVDTYESASSSRSSSASSYSSTLPYAYSLSAPSSRPSSASSSTLSYEHSYRPSSASSSTLSYAPTSRASSAPSSRPSSASPSTLSPAPSSTLPYASPSTPSSTSPSRPSSASPSTLSPAPSSTLPYASPSTPSSALRTALAASFGLPPPEGGGRYKYKGRLYRIYIGKKKGKYIVYHGKKIYIRQS